MRRLDRNGDGTVGYEYVVHSLLNFEMPACNAFNIYQNRINTILTLIMIHTHTCGVRMNNVLAYLSFFLFRLLSSGVATADFPIGPTFCILLRHINTCHALYHSIHKPSFRPFPFNLSWQFHPRHPSLNIPIPAIIFPPYMSKPPQVFSPNFPPVLPL